MITIIGAGISGLTLAYYLQQAGAAFRLLEASQLPGGYIGAIQRNGYLLETGPNSLLAGLEVKNILVEIGLTSRIQYPEKVSKKRFIYKQNGYKALSPPALLFSDFFSWEAKKSVWRERNRPAQHVPNETVAAFFERRFCREIVELAVNPFVSGIYAGDPDKLLIAKTFPSLAENERLYGSVIRGFFKQPKGAGRKESFSFVEGMQELPKALAKQLPVEYGKPVNRIRKNGQKWIVETQMETWESDQIVVCTPAYTAAPMLVEAAPALAQALGRVTYPAMYVVHTAFDRRAVSHPLNGFGGLHPKQAGLFTAGSIWTSSLFPNRCPSGQVLLTSFVGGMLSPDFAALPPAEVARRTTAELRQLFGIGAKPLFQQVTHWEKAIPQYDLNILPVHDQLPAWAAQGLHACANWTTGGVSVSDCMIKAKALAKLLVERG